jgi:hypothetical protein
MQGRYCAALGASRRLVKAVAAMEVASAIANGELKVCTPVATHLRFGRWDAVLAGPAPPEALTLDTVIWLYVRAFCYANPLDLAATKDAARVWPG